MKIVRLLLVFILVEKAAGAPNPEPRYDVFAKMLMPLASVFAQKPRLPNRALACTLRLEQMTDLAPELAGARAEIAVQYPDKLRVRGPVLGLEVTVARDGEELWAHPGARLAELLPAKPQPRRKKKELRLGPLELPFPEKQLVFLPALFEVRDVATETLDGESCRVLDVRLMPELEKKLEARGWVARVWIRGDYKPARLTLARPGWNAVVRVENMTLAKALPDTEWRPAAAQAEDVLRLNATQYRQLLDALVGVRP